MYTEIERQAVTRFVAAVPPIYREQRYQFALSLPWLALLSVVLIGIFGGWIGLVISVVRQLLIAPALVGVLIASPLFWLVLLPPILWALSFFPLRNRRLVGWRLFTFGTALSLIAALLGRNLFGNLFNIVFSAAILYFTLQVYDEFYFR